MSPFPKHSSFLRFWFAVEERERVDEDSNNNSSLSSSVSDVKQAQHSAPWGFLMHSQKTTHRYQIKYSSFPPKSALTDDAAS